MNELNKENKTINRDLSIDILRFFACILITNSHFDLVYGPYEKFATGGSIGDTLFFFCSGFTLFLGRLDRFDHWYKRRINRIYPTIFAWAIISAFFWHSESNMKEVLLFGGGWFVSCIMIYYVILYAIRKFMIDKLWLAFGLSCIIVVIWYLFENRPIDYNMYSADNYFPWCHYFLFMLLGAMIGVSKFQFQFSLTKDLLKLITAIIVYYAILFLCRDSEVLSDYQIISLLPLLMITFYFYKVCHAKCLSKLYQSKYIGWGMKLISVLTLEIYVVQPTLITDKFNQYFPLNLFVTFIIIVAVAYGVKVVARIFSQTFSESPKANLG